MKHIFFAYPAGAAGAALLLMRGSLTLFLIMLPSQASLNAWLALTVYLAAAGIILGFPTRFSAGLCAVICALLVWPTGVLTIGSAVSQAMTAIALSLIGPGAFSIDARLFGRHTIHLPD